MKPWRALIRRFWSDKRGNVAIIYGLAMIPIMIGAGAALDYARGVMVRASLTEALDAAGLAVGGSTNLSSDNVKKVAQAYFDANYKLDQTTYGAPVAITVSTSGQDITLSTNISMPTVIMRAFSVDALPISASVVITRNSTNIEVALALDTTGSMAGTKITDLKTAANSLIDIVVQDTQTPTYSKVAIAPYTMGVNLGTYAAQVRGPITTGPAITGATKANPVVITSANHGYANGDVVYISGVTGMTQLNGNVYTVANKTTNTFQLQGINGTSYSTYKSGGTAYCTKLGCQYYRFTNASGGTNMWNPSTCVTERTTNAYTDVSPSTTYLGYNYPATATNPCITATIMPLSSDKTALKSVVNGLSASGGTAGHIGIAWAWYLLSPNFSYLWPSASQQPAAYGTDKLIKVAIIMTDGAFNTPYCKGVISSDAGSGSTSYTTDRINCTAPNGSSASQAKNLCAGMKAQGIIVYTVGFDVGSDATAHDTLDSCATDSSHAYYPATGADLQSVFQSIAQQITNLRVKS